MLVLKRNVYQNLYLSNYQVVDIFITLLLERSYIDIR